MAFFDFLTGADERRDIKKAYAQAGRELERGLAEGVAAYEAGRERLTPFATGGTQAFNALLAATGVLGPEAQRGFVENFQFSPNVDLLQQGVARAMAARGLTDSGAARLAAGRVLLEDYNNQLNRLLNIGQMGQQAATTQGGFDAGIGDMRFGAGQLRANQAIDRGSAIAQTRNIGLNNLLNIAGTVARFVRPSTFLFG